MTLSRKRKNNERLPISLQKDLNLLKKTNKSSEHSYNKQGTGKFDSQRKNCANTFPRVRKQILLLETGVCIDYASFIGQF